MDARRAAVVGAVLVASALSACTGNGPPPGGGASSAPVSSEATAATTGASASVSPRASSPPPTARPNTPPPSPSRTAGFTTAAKRGGAAPSPASLLRLIRAGRHAGYERVVFEFAGPPPAYLVSYVSGVREDPSDRPVTLEGDAFLLVVMHGATLDTTPQVTDPTKARSYAGPRRIRPDLDAVQEIAVAGDFEGVLSFGIGIDQRAPFRVLRLTDPGRIVVDVATS